MYYDKWWKKHRHVIHNKEGEKRKERITEFVK
jgi:hypothetical protein